MWMSYVDEGNVMPPPFNLVPPPHSVIRLCSEVALGPGAKRLQFRSPRMTTFKSRSNASVKLFARDSKHVVGVCGGRYVLQIKNDLYFLH